LSRCQKQLVSWFIPSPSHQRHWTTNRRLH